MPETRVWSKITRDSVLSPDLSQVADTEGEILLSLVLEKCHQRDDLTLNELSLALREHALILFCPFAHNSPRISTQIPLIHVSLMLTVERRTDS